MDRINVLQLLTTSNIRGSENLVINFIEKSNQKIFRNYLCTLHPKGALHEHAEKMNMQPLSLGTEFNFLLAGYRLYKLIKKYRIEIIHVYGFRTDIISRLTIPFTKVKVLISAIHSVYENCHKIIFFIDKLFSPLVDLYISNSNRGRLFYQKNTQIDPSKYYTVHSGIDITNFKINHNTQFKRKAGIAKKTLIITMIAGITGEKGHDMAIQAFKLTLREINNDNTCKLVFIGKDYTNGSIEKIVNESNLSNDIIFMGFCENHLINEVLNETDIFLLPSQREGLPTVIIEAMRHGIPVIASDVGGIPELVQHGKTGYLAPPGDCFEFKDKLVHLIKNPQKRKLMGERGRCLVASQFSLDLMVGSIEQKYLELYRSKIEK